MDEPDEALPRPTPPLATVLTWSLLGAVFAFAAALAVTWGLLPGAVGLVVPLAVWYAVLSARLHAMEELDRRLAASAAQRGNMVRPKTLTLGEGGQVGDAPWQVGAP